MTMRISGDGSNWVALGHDPELMIPAMPLVRERTDKLSFPFGDISLTQIGLPDIFIVYGDVLFKHKKLHFNASDLPKMVELHFALTGSGTIHNHLSNQSHTFRPRTQNMFYMPHLNGTGEYLTEKNYQFFEVHFTIERFIGLVKDCGPLLQKFAEDIISGKYGQLYKDSLPISFAMHNCILDMINCPYTGGLKLLFLQSKSIELLVLQAEAFEKSDQLRKSSVLRSSYDKQCIYDAKDYLLQHADLPPSLGELSKIVGINEFKLKKGFKEVFNDTVFGYLNNFRLNQAKEMLLEGSSVSQVALALGYSSVPHFSGSFKKKYGVSPGKIKH